jgi:hypothetical protein
MTKVDNIHLISYDTNVFGMNVYEIKSLSQATLDNMLQNPGHYTIKIDPLASKKILHEYGFYYCDTLIEPFCSQDRFVCFLDDKISLSREIVIENLLALGRNVFEYGRFHRDFNLNKELAELRYLNWLKQLHQQNAIFLLQYEGCLAGFIAFDKNKLVLHALNHQFRGKHLAKFFWSHACKELFDEGYTELTSSISAANLSVVNLYASLGFRFRNSVDVYHCLIK